MRIENPRERLMMLYDSISNTINTVDEDVPNATFIDILMWYQEQIDRVLSYTRDVE